MRQPEESFEAPLSSLTAYDLIDLLNADYPARCIGPFEALENAHRYAGKRELVETLLQIREAEADAKD